MIKSRCVWSEMTHGSKAERATRSSRRTWDSALKTYSEPQRLIAPAHWSQRDRSNNWAGDCVSARVSGWMILSCIMFVPVWSSKGQSSHSQHMRHRCLFPHLIPPAWQLVSHTCSGNTLASLFITSCQGGKNNTQCLSEITSSSSRIINWPLIIWISKLKVFTPTLHLVTAVITGMYRPWNPYCLYITNDQTTLLLIVSLITKKKSNSSHEASSWRVKV